MIQAVRNLGNSIKSINSEEFKNPIDIFIDNIQYSHVIYIQLDLKNENQCSYNSINVKQIKPEITNKLLLRFYQGNVKTYPSPIKKFSSKKIEKNFEDAILGWFEREINDDLLDDKTRIFCTNIASCLKDSSEKIIEDISSIVTDFKFPEKSNIILTLIFCKNNQELYLRDFKVFREIFLQRTMEKFESKWNITSIKQNAICTLCHENKSLVYGCASDIFSWYTLDKRSFAPFMDNNNAWKLFPVCEDCIQDLELGKKFIEKNLNLLFNNYCPYYFIPYFLTEQLIDENYLEKLKGIRNITLTRKKNATENTLEEQSEREKRLKSKKVIRLDESIYENIFDTKKHDTIRMLGDKELNSVLLSHKTLMNFIFYHKSQSSIEILGTIEDVLPSRFSVLADYIRLIEQSSIFERENFNLGAILYHLYPKIDKIANPSYILALESILKSLKLSYNVIIDDISALSSNIMVDTFSKSQKLTKFQQKGTKRISQSTFQIVSMFQYLVFLNKLGLIETKRKKNMKDKEKMVESRTSYSNDKRVESLNKTFEDFEEFFYLPIIKAVFILGVLTQLLLNKQYVELNRSTPFINKLNGFKMNKRVIIKLLPELQNKLREYKLAYKSIEELMSLYFLVSGENWEATNNELSFYFVLGMNTARYYKIKKEVE